MVTTSASRKRNLSIWGPLFVAEYSNTGALQDEPRDVYRCVLVCNIHAHRPPTTPGIFISNYGILTAVKGKGFEGLFKINGNYAIFLKTSRPHADKYNDTNVLALCKVSCMPTVIAQYILHMAISWKQELYGIGRISIVLSLSIAGWNSSKPSGCMGTGVVEGVEGGRTRERVDR